MIGYITLGSNNLDQAKKIYDEILLEMGCKRLFGDHFLAWGENEKSPMLSILKPFDKKEATIGNGVMVALKADSKEEVDKVYNKAMKLGAISEGLPNFRSDNFYGAYFRDLDGNKLNVHFTTRI